MFCAVIGMSCEHAIGCDLQHENRLVLTHTVMCLGTGQTKGEVAGW